ALLPFPDLPVVDFLETLLSAEVITLSEILDTFAAKLEISHRDTAYPRHAISRMVRGMMLLLMRHAVLFGEKVADKRGRETTFYAVDAVAVIMRTHIPQAVSSLS
ncbi:hypothetical protein KIPB_014741, partial [Kipferlia bialata]